MAESNISEIENKEIGVGDSSAQSLATKLEQARIHRHQGNAKFEAKIYKAAIGEYHRAILYLKAIDMQPTVLQTLRSSSSNAERLPVEVANEVRELKIACYNNLSVCILKSELPNYQKVVQYCDLVLKEDVKNVKALYRKGLALYNLKDPASALDVLKKAKNMPGISTELVAEIQSQIVLCQEAVAVQDQKLKDTYRNMFQRGESVSQQ